MQFTKIKIPGNIMTHLHRNADKETQKIGGKRTRVNRFECKQDQID